MSATKPFFISTKEISLFDSMNEELIDEFVGQSVDIYKINTQHTKDNIYGESTTKYFNVGFRVNCLIRYNAPEVEQFESVGADVNSTIEMNGRIPRRTESNMLVSFNAADSGLFITIAFGMRPDKSVDIRTIKKNNPISNNLFSKLFVFQKSLARLLPNHPMAIREIVTPN